MTKINQPMLNEDCAACCSPQRAALLTQRELGNTIEAIAANNGYDLAVLEEHFDQHVSPALDDAEKALRDCEELYFAAVLSNNMNAAASALSVRARMIAERNRRKASANKTKSVIAGADPRDPSTWPEELSAFFRAHFDSIIERAAECEATL